MCCALLIPLSHRGCPQGRPAPCGAVRGGEAPAPACTPRSAGSALPPGKSQRDAGPGGPPTRPNLGPQSPFPTLSRVIAPCVPPIVVRGLRARGLPGLWADSWELTSAGTACPLSSGLTFFRPAHPGGRAASGGPGWRSPVFLFGARGPGPRPGFTPRVDSLTPFPGVGAGLGFPGGAWGHS